MTQEASKYIGQVWGDERITFWIKKYFQIGNSSSPCIILKGIVIGGSSYPIGAHFSVPIDLLDGKGMYRHKLTWWQLGK